MVAQHIADSVHQLDPSHIYRYRTKALVGPWRRTRAQAMADALHAGQARRNERDRHEILWLVDGWIEERSSRGPEAGGEDRRVAPPRGP